MKQVRVFIVAGITMIGYNVYANSVYELPSVPPPPAPLYYDPHTAEKQDVFLHYVGPMTEYSVDEALTYLEPFLASRSVEKAVEQFVHLPQEKAVEILTTLMNNNHMGSLPPKKTKEGERRRNDFLQIILGVAHFYPSSKDKHSFFELIDTHEGLRHGVRPILFIASISSFPMIIPDIVQWLAQKQNKQELLLVAARYGIDRRSSRSIHALCSQLHAEMKPLLGKLLLYATQQNTSKSVVAALLTCGADANYPDASGYTPLIKAVELEHGDAVKLLLEHGGNLDLVVKDEVGSAWQKAGEINNTALVNYITNHHSKKLK